MVINNPFIRLYFLGGLTLFIPMNLHQLNLLLSTKIIAAAMVRATTPTASSMGDLEASRATSSPSLGESLVGDS